MKQLIAAAMLAALASPSLAQESPEHMPQPRWYPSESATERNFCMPADWINIRDYIYLPNKAKMIVELTHVAQYNELKFLDTLLANLMRDIAFYKDSLADNPGSVRIDYAPDEALAINKIRFKKHPADGNIFMARNGDKARLKIEQDSVRIYVRHNPLTPTTNTGKLKNSDFTEMYNNARFYQVTLCLNNYEDIANIAADRSSLLHAIDTMMSTKRKSTRNDPRRFPSSARYNPYATRDDIKDNWWRAVADVRFKQYSGLVKAEDPNSWKAINRSDKLILDANLGASLLRNYLAPTAEIGLHVNRQSRRPYNGEYHIKEFGISASCNFLFERSASNDYYSKPNWFVNATFSEERELTAGVGYLFYSKGDFFKGTTAKFFLDVRPWKKGLTLSPELIFTNNFQQVIPALTIKVF